MESEHFDALRWPAEQGGKEELLPHEKQFHICLKLDVRADRKPVLVFCRADNLDWNDVGTGYLLSFDKSFFHKAIWCNFEGIDLFQGGDPINIELDEEGVKILTPVFDKVCDSITSTYLYKYDLVRTYIFQIIHQTIKMNIRMMDIVRSPVRYVTLTTCGIDMLVRIKLGHKH